MKKLIGVFGFFVAFVVVANMLPESAQLQADSQAYYDCMKDPTMKFAADMKKAELRSNLDSGRIQHIICQGH